MATASVSNSFTGGTTAVAAEVNENFDDIVSFLNEQAIQKDASLAFTSIPSGPDSNPSSDNQFARKKYVDLRAPRIVARKQHFEVSEYADTSTPTDLNVDWSFVVPTLLTGQYLKFTVFAPKVQVGGPPYPIVGGAMKLYVRKGTDILCYGQSSVTDALGFDAEGSSSLYGSRLWSASEVAATVGAAGDTVNLKTYGATSPDDTGKWRLYGEANSPVQFTVEVV
jgi:hypothetical protein